MTKWRCRESVVSTGCGGVTLCITIALRRAIYKLRSGYWLRCRGSTFTRGRWIGSTKSTDSLLGLTERGPLLRIMLKKALEDGYKLRRIRRKVGKFSILDAVVGEAGRRFIWKWNCCSKTISEDEADSKHSSFLELVAVESAS